MHSPSITTSTPSAQGIAKLVTKANDYNDQLSKLATTLPSLSRRSFKYAMKSLANSLSGALKKVDILEREIELMQKPRSHSPPPHQS